MDKASLPIRNMAKKEKPVEPDRILIPGKPDVERCDNKVVSAKYTIWNFFFKVRANPTLHRRAR